VAATIIMMVFLVVTHGNGLSSKKNKKKDYKS